MGSYDGAEVCDLVGLYILSELEKLKLNVNLGCYKDDCLAVSGLSPQATENFKKKICQSFKNLGLSITIEAINTKIVKFLDVEFNLENESYKPYLKPGDSPVYVNSQSNHPPSVKKNIPEAINRRLSNLSSDETQFLSIAPVYQEAIKSAGYNYKLNYKPQKVNNSNKKRNRKKHNVLWWNPPWSDNVKTNIGKEFFKLLDQHFPKDHPLHKILNRNTVKMAYRNSPNMKKIIAAHNTKILKPEEPTPPCNCRDKEDCPLQGKCRVNNMVYQATITTKTTPPVVETYTGMTETEFKDRYRNHKKSFKHAKYKKETTLSKYLWKLDGEKTDYSLEWKIIGRAKPYNPVTRVCALCTLEKFFIITKPHQATLNKKSEMFNKCPHMKGLLLDKT